ncbi:TPR-like protein [Fistulina hepatica ATCC 64428]|nr:TPR-like protein [Fistulina hepatica ATCC 64428]
MSSSPMASSNSHLAQQFQSLIWSCLDADLTRSAIFYAERYFATDQNSHDARHIYATALLRDGDVYPALRLVTTPPDRACYLCLDIKAKCCTKLGRQRQARDAIETMFQDAAYPFACRPPPRQATLYPEEAALRAREGTACLKGNLPDQAAIHFRAALALNPMIWEAFDGLCSLGKIPDIDELFPPRVSLNKRPPEDVLSVKFPVTTGAGFFTPEAGGNVGNLFRGFTQAFRPPPGPRDSMLSNDSSFYPDASLQQLPRNAARMQLAPSQPSHLGRPLSSAEETGPLPKRLRSNTRQEPAKPKSKEERKPASSRTTRSNSQSTTNPPQTRRSTRIGTTAAKTLKVVDSNLTAVKHMGRRKAIQRSKSHDSDDENSPSATSNAQSPRSEGSPARSKEQDAAALQELQEIEMADNHIYNLMRQFARAARALALYDCDGCLQELEQLPDVHQQSPCILAMAGKAHYERQNFLAADRAFKSVRVLEPFRLQDMETYSSLLWTLQLKPELSFLAQELLNINPRASQGWIAAGNLFSLQRERAKALTCFRRATQVDPSCAYAYTLSGLEVIDEDLDGAITYFQNALRADQRHYNAWYGLGTCYMRQSKIRMAEFHYRKAVEIHPTNAVLLGCVGMAVERRGDRRAALELFDKAIRLQTDNALTRYRRAKILIALKRYKATVEDLEFLRNVSPEEANVVFQLAKAYRLMGDELKSAQTLAVVRDIAPKSMNKVRKLLELEKDTTVASDPMDEG